MLKKVRSLLIFERQWSNNDRGLVKALEKYAQSTESYVVCRGSAGELQNSVIKSFDLTHGFTSRYIKALFSKNYTLLPLIHFFFFFIFLRPEIVYLREIYFLNSIIPLKKIFKQTKIVLDVRENPRTHYPHAINGLIKNAHLLHQVRTNSPGLKLYLQSEFNINSVIMVYALPTNAFVQCARNTIKKRNNVLNNVLRICFFGYIRRDRLLHIVVEAVNKIDSDVCFDVYGKIVDNDYKKHLEHLDVNGRVVLHGELEYINAPEKLVYYDLAVMMNEINDNSKHTIPGKLWEYTCCGLPIISNSRPTVESFVVDNNIGVIADTADEIVEQLTSLIECKDTLKVMGGNAYLFFNNYYKFQEQLN